MSLTGTPNLLVRSSAAASRFDPHAPDLRKLASDADVDVALMGTILRAGSRLRAVLTPMTTAASISRNPRTAPPGGSDLAE